MLFKVHVSVHNCLVCLIKANPISRHHHIHIIMKWGLAARLDNDGRLIKLIISVLLVSLLTHVQSN